MILVDPNLGARIITFPDMTGQFTEYLKDWYSPEKAAEYAEKLQESVKENADFPKEGIYMLKEGVFYSLNLKKCAWQKGKSKQDYVIDESKAFWKKISQKFSYLFTMFEENIRKIIGDTTSKMFDVDFEATSFISIDNEGDYTLSVPEDNAIINAVSGFVRNRENFLKLILKDVFHSDKMPIFILDCGKTVAAITNERVMNDIDVKALDAILSAYFAPDDAKKLKIRLSNAIKYGVNSEEKVAVNELGEIVLEIGEIHVLPFDDGKEVCELANDSHNRRMLVKLINQQLVESTNVYGGTYLEFKDGYVTQPTRLEIKMENGKERPVKDGYEIEYTGQRYTVTVQFETTRVNEVYLADLITLIVETGNGVPRVSDTDLDISEAVVPVRVATSKDD